MTSRALRFQSQTTGNYLNDSTELAAPPATSLRALAQHARCAGNLAKGARGLRPAFWKTTGSCWLGKFPSRDDRYDVGAWEFVVHELAREAKIEVPRARLEKLTTRYGTFCVARFDRNKGHRRMFASAMTLLDRRDGADASYLDIAQLIADQGASKHVKEDLAQLFRRVVFNVLVSNRDDHLRNHGFLRTASGWRLAPAFDLNPNLDKHEHALLFDEASAEPHIDAVLATAEYYRLSAKQAGEVASNVNAVVKTWKATAVSAGLGRSEIQRMALAFERES